MKFGKQLKLQSVKEWQEYYMSYKRLKRIIKKLMVQLKEQEEKQLALQAAGGGSGPAGTGTAINSGPNTPINGSVNAKLLLHSYSPNLSARNDAGDETTPPQQQSKLRNRLVAAVTADSPASSKGSPGLTVGGDAYQEFFSVVDSDIEKVNKFFASKYEELLTTFNTISASADPALEETKRKNSGSQKRVENDSVTPTDGGDGTTIPSSGLTGSVAAVSAWMRKQHHKSSASTDKTAQVNYGTLEQGGLEAKENDRLLPTSASNVSTASTHTITTSQQKKLEARLEKLLDLYRLALQLQLYSFINFEGLRKIVKKFDKNTGEDHTVAFVQRLEAQPFHDTRQINHLIGEIEDLYTKWNCRRPNQDIWSSQSMLRNVKREVDNPKEEEESGLHASNWLFLLLAASCAGGILLLPILPHDPRAKSCAALLSFITISWVTEAVPFFVTALAIPFLTVLLGILGDPTGEPLTADKASKAAFGFMFNDTIMLIIGGFSISSAFSKCNFELRLASMIQRMFGDSPKMFLLAFMMLGAFLSCWISNIAAPVLLTSLLLPIVRDFGSTNSYARALLLGLAFSCNIGGMMSPISSPQNAIALGYLEQAIPNQGISFSAWLCVSIPFCFIMVLIAWTYLVVVFLAQSTQPNVNEDGVPLTVGASVTDTNEVKEIPMIIYEKSPINGTQITVIIVTLLTIVLWCTLSSTKNIFGEMGTIAVLPAVVFFGTGILNKTDLLGFSWNLILLIGGGNVLGAAVNSSQLLHIISQGLTPYLSGHTAYATTIAVLSAVFLVTTFVSHTVAALILTPIIVDIASSSGEVQIVLMTATLMMSGAMSLPMSSFPNANSLLVDDDFSRPFLHPIDYIKHGTAISVACFIAIATVGYALCYVFLDHDSGTIELVHGTHHM